MKLNTPASIFIHSPLVGRSFWTPVARELERRGRHCHTPTTEQREDGLVPAWRDWPNLLHTALPITSGAILVGHSAAGMLLPALAKKVGARVLIFIDANIPHELGTAPPVDA